MKPVWVRVVMKRVKQPRQKPNLVAKFVYQPSRDASGRLEHIVRLLLIGYIKNTKMQSQEEQEEESHLCTDG
jgi:hypothetical protein